MGRNRSFDEDIVIASCANAFRRSGFEGTSIDDLVAASGLHRGSLYQAFGSKRGLFLAALEAQNGSDDSVHASLDLLLIALLELAPRDADVRLICVRQLDELGTKSVQLLGERLLARASIDPFSRKGTEL